MTLHIETTRKNYLIDVLRKNGFNCFPIPQYPNTYKQQKGADIRYDAERTALNQIITEHENFGYIGINGNGNATIDLDNKERYRKFAEEKIKEGYMVIESPHGWHLPVKGLTGKIAKVNLYDYDFQPKKQIIEIHGFETYCVGPESIVWDEDYKTQVKYESKGSEKIWDLCGISYDDFVTSICDYCNVTTNKKSRSTRKEYRERFKEGKIPTPGTSNDYFFESARQCKIFDKLPITTAIEKIKIIYDKWVEDGSFSGRSWEDIERKIETVYEENDNSKGGRPRGSSKEIDRTGIAQKMLKERLFYSDTETHDIFENKRGFLERVNDNLKKEIYDLNNDIEQADYNSILFKLEAGAKPIPETNKNLIVFKSGVLDIENKKTIDTDELADMGFKDYNYLPKTEENKPVKWYGIMFDNVDKKEHARIKAGLRSALSNYLDSRISIIHGLSRVGKSTGLNILAKVLDQYALAIELNLFLEDKFIRAKVKGLRLLVFQEVPENWKHFSTIKALTGEQLKSERGFMQDSCKFENKLKIWASGNYLPKIPENEKNSMYTSRLSLIQNNRKEPYAENPKLLDEIAKNEGEKIISWILNLDDSECKYEDSKTLKEAWENLASPEIDYLENNYETTSDKNDTSIMTIIKNFRDRNPEKVMDINTMKDALESQGFIIKYNIIKNLKKKN